MYFLCLGALQGHVAGGRLGGRHSGADAVRERRAAHQDAGHDLGLLSLLTRHHQRHLSTSHRVWVAAFVCVCVCVCVCVLCVLISWCWLVASSLPPPSLALLSTVMLLVLTPPPLPLLALLPTVEQAHNELRADQGRSDAQDGHCLLPAEPERLCVSADGRSRGSSLE